MWEGTPGVLSHNRKEAADIETLLVMLKTDLGLFNTTAYDTRLQKELEAAIAAIKEEGAETLNTDNPLDAQLVVMYAAWLWRRRDDMTGMPRMLRYQLNNRVLGEAMGGSP